MPARKGPVRAPARLTTRAARSAARKAPARRKSAASKPASRGTGRNRRQALIDRLWRAVERQVRLAEKRLAALAGDPDRPEAPDEAAKLLASLARTLKELSALDQAGAASAPPDDKDDDAPPRDMEAFRTELARKLDRILAEETDPESLGEDDGEGEAGSGK
jgi:hypothetical protein